MRAAKTVKAKGKLTSIRVDSTFWNDECLKCQVLKIIKDKDKTIIVYKYYLKNKALWHYEAITLNAFNFNIKYGLFILRGGRKKR